MFSTFFFYIKSRIVAHIQYQNIYRKDKKVIVWKYSIPQYYKYVVGNVNQVSQQNKSKLAIKVKCNVYGWND